MKTKEFNLSEKIRHYDDFDDDYINNLNDFRFLHLESVKEFIRLLKEKGRTKKPDNSGEYCYILSEEEIDTLAGKELLE